MKLNLDDNMKHIYADLKLRGTKAMKFASALDVITIGFFYFWIIWFLLHQEWMTALALFAVKTLWKISMALQDITRAVNMLNVFAIIKLDNSKDKENED